MEITPLKTAILLFAVSVAGALLPLYRRWSERGLHLFVSVSAGVFLGTIFLHLLPHMAGGGHDHGHGHAHGGESANLGPWIAALLGLLVLFALERVWLRRITQSANADPHMVLWSATYLGLTLHAISAGVGLPSVLENPDARTQFLISVLIHKASETFSLATVMRLAGLRTSHALVLLLLFAMVEPAGFLFGGELAALSPGLDALLTGFACGTFLYVAVCDLLPEVFHGTDRPLLKLCSVLVGVAISAANLPYFERGLDFAYLVLLASFDVFVDMAPYLVLGFVIAGVLHLFMKPEWLTRHLAKDDLKSVTIASLVGAPLPLCSCSVVPVAAALRRAGASKGATSSFLISTPETGVDSVLVTWALLDPILTIARPVGAILSAIFTGSLVNAFVRRGLDRSEPRVAAAPAAACEHDHSSEPAHGHAHEHGHPHEHRSSAPAHVAPAPRRATGWVARVLRYAFVEMLDDLAPSMLVGIVLSGAIVVALPAEVFQTPMASGFSGMILMLLVGIPVYVCASASTPIAAVLLMKGMSPGAALVFLLAGPATNLGTLVIASRLLGARVVVVQVVALVVSTLALGLAVDALYAWLGAAPAVRGGAVADHAHGWFAQGCALALGALMIASVWRNVGTRQVLTQLQTKV